MARQKAFDRDAALDRAMAAFWSRGYAATSIEYLVARMGIQRGSLYATFGDKRSLFLSALERYERVVVRELFEALEAPGSGLEAIRRFFRLRVRGALDRSRPGGCLVTNSAVELSRRDRGAAAQVGRALAKLEAAFLHALERAHAQGELAATRDLRALARFLASSAQGLSVMAKAFPERAVLEDVVQVVLAALEDGRPGPRRAPTRKQWRDEEGVAMKAMAFDAYGTLFDVYSVTALCEALFPGTGDALAQRWRLKQLQYSMLRSLMGRHRDFWRLTEDALVYAAKSLGLDLTPDKRARLLEAYLTLTAFPDVTPGLQALKRRGLRLAILSNGEPKMLEAAARSAGIVDLLDTILSVEEVKIFKPSPRVYHLAPEHLRVRPAELGFVSSNGWDVVGAASVGFETFWIQRRAAEPPEELGFTADHTVSTITDLAALLRG